MASTDGCRCTAAMTSGDSVCSWPTVGRIPGPTNRSACSVCPTQYTTVSRKLPIMIAMATIIERLTDSAATEIDRRGMAEVRLACASSPSTPRRRRKTRRPARASPYMIAGTSRPAPITIANDDRYPNSGRPLMGPSCARPKAIASTASGAINIAGRRRCRMSSVSWPRMAAVGSTRLASSDGIAAASSDSGRPMAAASHTCPQFMSGGAEAAAM